MEHHLAIGERADGLAVFTDVGDQHDAWQEAGIALGKVFRRPVQFAELAEIAGHADEILLRQALTREDDHEVVEPRLVDGADGLVIGLFAQIEPTNFGPDVLRQRNHVEPRPGYDVHGVSSAALATLLSRTLLWRVQTVRSSSRVRSVRSPQVS